MYNCNALPAMQMLQSSYSCSRQGSVLFNFTITFPKETETDEESFANDLQKNGLGNYTTEVNKIENVNRKFVVAELIMRQFILCIMYIKHPCETVETLLISYCNASKRLSSVSC
jgi:hypothetical protein